MASFDDATALERLSETGWRGEIPAGWRIGDVPNGGLVLALAGRALGEAMPHPDPFTLHILFLSPTTLGPVDIEVEVLRAGGSTSHGRASLRQDGDLKAVVTASCTRLEALDGEDWSPVTRPEIAPVTECAPAPGNGIELRNSVHQHYVRGGQVFRGGAPDGGGCFEGWLSFVDRRHTDLLSLLLFSDAMAPPIFTVYGVLNWVPTVDLSVQLRAHPAPGPVQVRFASRHMTSGVVEEDGEIWDSEGRLVALTRGTSKVRMPPG